MNRWAMASASLWDALDICEVFRGQDTSSRLLFELMTDKG